MLISIDKSTQTMTVTVDGYFYARWPVSTGKIGRETPAGDFKPFRMEEDHFSKEWDDAPMPFSIFFTPQGHAIHGTLESRKLGTAASHGCVRLKRENAAMLYGLVTIQGLNKTKVEIRGVEPQSAAPLVAGRQNSRQSDWQTYNAGPPVDSRRTDALYDDQYAAMPTYRQRPRAYYDSAPQPYYAPRYYQQQPYGYR
jgi:hypothetical protein